MKRDDRGDLVRRGRRGQCRRSPARSAGVPARQACAGAGGAGRRSRRDRAAVLDSTASPATTRR